MQTHVNLGDRRILDETSSERFSVKAVNRKNRGHLSSVLFQKALGRAFPSINLVSTRGGGSARSSRMKSGSNLPRLPRFYDFQTTPGR